MTNKILPPLLLMLFAASVFAKTPDRAILDKSLSTVIKDTLHTAILPEDRACTILLPRSYGLCPDKEYPVLYLLHGLWGDNDSWVYEFDLKSVVDRLTHSGEAKEMIIVMPNAGGNPEKGDRTGYFNMPDWPFEDYFFKELVPYVENKYRIKKGKEFRAIAGLSMGGGGSTVYCQHHPEMFCAVYAMSAAMTRKDSDPVKSNGNRLLELLIESMIEHDASAFVKNADEATINRLRTVEWFVDCGDDDYLLDVNTEFYKSMREAGIPCEFRVRDGGHDKEYWHTALYFALPFISRNFAESGN